MAFELPPLPWAKDALAPTISAETIDYHYGKHHKTYVDNLWNVTQQSGKYRYYQESVYLLGLLAVAGKYNHAF